MSFLSELKKQKDKLKGTETIVTTVGGKRYIEKGDDQETIGNAYGFVVDTKPDDIPVLIADFLYIGSQDCAAINVLESYKIKRVLSIGIEVEVSNVEHKFVDCLDLPETDIKAVLTESLPFLREAVELEENILIHCNAGVSRTSMVAIGYLMHYEGMEFEKAYSFVKDKRPAVQPNAGFRKQLQASTPGKVI